MLNEKSRTILKVFVAFGVYSIIRLWNYPFAAAADERGDWLPLIGFAVLIILTAGCVWKLGWFD